MKSISVIEHRCPQNYYCPVTSVCPTVAILQTTPFEALKIDKNKCTNCARCTRFCAFGAFQFN